MTSTAGLVEWENAAGKTVLLDPEIEWARSELDFWYFLNFVMVEDSVKGIVPFERWPYLEPIARDWQGGYNCVEGKARQLGYSVLLGAFGGWKATFFDHANVICFSIGKREAQQLIRKVQFTHDHLPPFLALPYAKSGLDVVELQGSESRVRAFPSTPTAGSGEQATVVISDELAKHPNAAANFTSYRAAIAQGGQHIIASTGWGVTGMFRDFFEGAAVYDPEARERGEMVLMKGVTGPNGYRARFNGFYARPDRDEAMYEQERQAYLSLGRGPTEFYRENAVSIEEMFGATARLVYGNYNPAVHMRETPFLWEMGDLRVAGVDPGQGDLAACIVVGQFEGHNHQFDEWGHEGTTTAGQIITYLKEWHRRAPFHAILVDHNEGTLIATMQAAGLPALPANKERNAGFGLVEAMLESGAYSHAPHCVGTQQEFRAYRYSERTIPGESQLLVTNIPGPGHADRMDALRYALMWISQFGAETLKKRQGQPQVWAAAEQERRHLEQGNRPVVVGSEEFSLVRQDPLLEREPVRPGYGPDYRPAARRKAMQISVGARRSRPRAPRVGRRGW